MYRYRNVRTDQVVARRERDARLDRLDVWELLGDEPAPAVEPVAPAGNRLLGQNPESVAEPAPELDAEPSRVAPATGDVEPDPVDEAPRRPNKAASRAAWAGWASHPHGGGLTSAEVEPLTKAQIIARFEG